MQDTPTTHPLDGSIREILDLPEAERFDALASACQKLGGIVIRPRSASHRIAHPDRCDDGHLISACRIIPANSLDQCGRERASRSASCWATASPAGCVHDHSVRYPKNGCFHPNGWALPRNVPSTTHGQAPPTCLARIELCRRNTDRGDRCSGHP
jgi:hypothetical protein